ncbi:ATPase [Lophiostoma macrostomum CBS 122681]|uniref:ATPase n=1 Tax=Lophiostoma macrostomum CBS 122681 TaxID=1314788 RepID=A0A6A6T4Y6_9PLEO|nr:ATPase [Lophiostoma macrostomum CBS 122681]
MSEETSTPPGLEALANHLGYTFVKKDVSSSSSSDNGDATGSDSKGSPPPPPPPGGHRKRTKTSDSDQSKKDKDEKDGDTEPPVPVGSLNSSANIYWNKDDDTWTSKEPEDTKPAEGKDTIGHAIVIRQQKSSDSRKKYEIHSIVVQSPSLKIALGDILEDYPGVCCNLDRLVFKAPFQPFVHRWGALLEYMEREDLETVTKEHMTLLHTVLKKELGDTIKAFEDYVTNGVVTYEHAWIIFQPQAVIVAPSGPGEIVAVRLKNGFYAETDDGNVYSMNCQRVDWNGKSFGWADEHVQLPEFIGVKPISELPIFPLAFHADQESVRLGLIERGKRFAALSGYHYRSYNGPALQRTQNGNILVQNNGRIIIDTDSFCKQPDQSPPPIRTDWNTELSVKEEADAKPIELTDFQYMLCTPILRGYSVKAKKWLSFYINHVKPIKWDDGAFENLVLPKTQKKLVMALSKTQAASVNNFDDIVSGKGKGMILLLSGPPGVGKTLTAEAVSENMRVPLYMMSAGDLGIRPEEVEQNLENILEMVAKWKAILLIDECDVFLEARSIHDMERNKLVSIFLRLLEYYQGTLFLTTNRVENMDPAFQSRIHVHLKYKDLSNQSRRQIWSSFLEKMPSNFSDGELEELAGVMLNGRQIKNLVKTAQLLALEEKKTLSKEHVDLVLAIEEGFEDE